MAGFNMLSLSDLACIVAQDRPGALLHINADIIVSAILSA